MMFALVFQPLAKIFEFVVAFEFGFVLEKDSAQADLQTLAAAKLSSSSFSRIWSSVRSGGKP